jgi:plasmid stabilization system protein ParE
MEKEVKKVVTSAIFKENRRKVYKYGAETFGDIMADIFMEHLENIMNELEYQYKLHPECKYLPTKGKIYRNIIFGKYLVIYRIASEKVEVLTLLHSSRSITKIKTTRSIKI